MKKISPMVHYFAYNEKGLLHTERASKLFVFTENPFAFLLTPLIVPPWHWTPCAILTYGRSKIHVLLLCLGRRSPGGIR